MPTSNARECGEYLWSIGAPRNEISHYFENLTENEVRIAGLAYDAIQQSFKDYCANIDESIIGPKEEPLHF